MDYVKSIAVGTLLAFCGVVVGFVLMFVVGTTGDRPVSVDIRSIRSSYFWIPAAILFLAGFYFEFRRLRSS